MNKKINMVIINNVPTPRPANSNLRINPANLAALPAVAAPNAPSSLNAPILARVHNVRPGCGSCGRH